MYSNSAKGATSSWIVRTSTPKKVKVNDFDPGPSTSFDPIVSLPRFDLSSKRSSKPKIRKGSIIDMICEAIEDLGSPTKGASYIAIHKWIINNRKNGNTKSLRMFVRKAISKGLENGLLKRSPVSKGAVGVQGYFIINKKYCSHKSRSSVVKPKVKIPKKVDKVKSNQAETVGTIQTSQEDPTPQDSVLQVPVLQDPTPQSVLASILKIKEAFEEASLSVLQQATKVLEVATKLMEASKSLALNRISEQSLDVTNSDVEMPRVVPMQSRQDEVRVVSMQFSQGGEAAAVPKQSVKGEARVAPIQSVQGEARVAPMQSAQGDARLVPMQSAQGDARLVPMQSAQGDAHVVPMESSQGEARVVPMESSQGESRVAPMQSVQGEARVVPMQSSQGEARVVPMESVQGTENQVSLSPLSEDQVCPRNTSSGAENQIVYPNSTKDELQVSRPQSNQIREAQVASVQPFQISEMQVAPNENLQIVGSRANQCSAFQEANNTSQRELSDEDVGEQRSLNFSLNSSFGVQAEVSGLIKHLGEQL